VLVSLLIAATSSVAAAASTGPQSPTICVNDTAIGTTAWNFPERALASDNSPVVKSIAHELTNYLRCSGFGFSIASSELIDGILVENEVRIAGPGEIAQDGAQRLVRSGVIGSTDRSSATSWTSSDVYLSHGNSSDLWGECWCAKPAAEACDNPACGNVNAADFGAALAALHTVGGGGSVRVDHVRITIFHSAATPTRTPTQTPTSTSTSTPTQTPSITSTGTITPTATQTATPTILTNACTDPAPSNPCIPGAGSKTTDCHIEWLATPVPLLDEGVPKPDSRRGIQRNRLFCYEGDPRCDNDTNLDNNSCTFFDIFLCINNTDPRFPICVASGLSTFEVKAPAPSSNDPADAANRVALEGQADGAAGGLGLTVVRGNTTVHLGGFNSTPNLCSRSVELTVPLKATTSGARRSKRKVKVAVTTTAGIKDIDALTLECRPSTCSNGSIEDDHETCDDGNRDNGDGCDQACQTEPEGPTPTITDTATATPTETLAGPTATPTDTVPATTTATPSPTATTDVSKLFVVAPGGGSSGSCRGVCSGGINAGASCGSVADCRICQGGTRAGLNCTAAGNCPGGSCPTGGTCGGAKQCVGGPYSGLTCASSFSCDGCNPSAICTGNGVPLACCTANLTGNCPLVGSCAVVQQKGNALPLALNGTCSPRAAPDVFCSTNAECAPLGKTCEFSKLNIVVGDPDGDGEATLMIPQGSVSLAPAVVTGLGVACVSAGGDGHGVVDCDGGRADLHSATLKDHNTTPGNAGNSGSAAGQPDDATCTNLAMNPGGTVSRACLEGTKQCVDGVNAGNLCTDDSECPTSTCQLCNATGAHGICNGPTEVTQSGTFAAGDQTILLPLGITLITNTANYGPDQLPCTGDDTATPSGTVQVVLSTGTSSATIMDANNVAASKIGPSSEQSCTSSATCPTGELCRNTSNSAPCSTASCACRTICGSKACVSSAVGAPLSCTNLDAGTLTGLTLAGGFPALHAPTVNDIATFFRFAAQ